MSFGQPWAFALLLAVPVVIALYGLAVWRRRKAMLRFADESQLPRLTNGEGAPRFILRAALIAAALGLLALAAAQPRWGTTEAEAVRRGSDVVVVLDTSLSMAARDIEPDRLGKAREEIGSLVRRLQGDRVGLVVFAGEAEVRFPLTDDDQAALAVIEEVRTTPSLDEGSSLFEGLTLARELLADSEAESRVIILVSDGENFGDAPIDAGFAAAQAGITIHTVGVGTEEGTTIPVVDPDSGEETVKIDGRSGQPAISRLNPTLLSSIAEVGGGGFFQLSSPEDTAAGALASEVRALAQTNLSSRTAELPIERFQLFAAAAFALLLLERFVPERALRFSRRPVLVPAGLSLVVFLGASCSGTSFEELIEDGNERFIDADFSAALDLYREAGAEDPERAEADYNAANALYRIGQYDRAISEYLRALDVAEGSLVEDIYFNLGNAYFQSGLYDEAISAYREVLLRDPDHANAKFNLELALLARATGGGTNPDGSADPESNSSSGQEGEGETEESMGDESEGQPGEEGQPSEEAIEEALGELGDEVSIEEALAILDQLEELEANEEGDEIDIVGIDDY